MNMGCVGGPTQPIYLEEVMDTLSKVEAELLDWLGEEDYSQYGECYGRALDHLVELGLAKVHGPGEYQHFIANDPAGTKGMNYRAVSLTEVGLELRRQIKNG